jgi:hypothetical protein
MRIKTRAVITKKFSSLDKIERDLPTLSTHVLETTSNCSRLRELIRFLLLLSLFSTNDSSEADNNDELTMELFSRSSSSSSSSS